MSGEAHLRIHSSVDEHHVPHNTRRVKGSAYGCDAALHAHPLPTAVESKLPQVRRHTQRADRPSGARARNAAVHKHYPVPPTSRVTVSLRRLLRSLPRIDDSHGGVRLPSNCAIPVCRSVSQWTIATSSTQRQAPHIEQYHRSSQTYSSGD
eukprot:scaffold79236_cov32-Tisochrysis_lutea.AAC.7